MKTFGSATTFHVLDLGVSLRFYTDVLGFSERFRFGDYAGIFHGDAQIHLSGPLATNKKPIGQGSIYIFCDDVDSYYSEVSRRGAHIQAPPKDYEYGMRDFVVEDPDLNLVAFGQETPQAIKS
ncbi:MAG: VOC family protein [Verrucomicrobiota bacterium]